MGRKAIRLTCFMLALSAVFLVANASEKLIPGGQLVGVQVKSDGLIYVGASDLGTRPSPARLAGLRGGDVIKGVNGVSVKTVAELESAIRENEEAKVEIERNGRRVTFSLTPEQDPRDGKTKIGAWVRQSVAGIGTLTFLRPGTGEFAALGHGISDPDAGVLVPVYEGEIYEGGFAGVNKGKIGAPGELMGEIIKSEPLGEIKENGQAGIRGTYTRAALSGFLYPDGLETAEEREILAGRAQLISTVNSEGPALYDIEILRVNRGANDKNLFFKVTDKTLLNQTGGIVQGMSGSPIIQNGKLIGAVTHVLVNDPTSGYGIFIENMLENAA